MPKDPYRYFRIEAQELLEGLGQGLLELENGADEDLVRRLLRQAHTFKGASRVVKRADIGDLAHQIEDLLSPHRESGGPVERGTIDEALRLLDEIGELVASLEAGPSDEAPATGPRQKTLEADTDTIRIAVRELDGLLEAAFEAHTAAASLRREGQKLDRLRTEARELLFALEAERNSLSTSPVVDDIGRLASDLDRAQRGIFETIERVLVEIGEFRRSASELRLVPAQTLMSALTRSVRDAARTLDKDVDVHYTGADTDVDAHVLVGLRQALMHVVRNSVAHGIESREERQRAGKPQAGRIDISIERRRHRVLIRCRDDGRGLDLESVRRVAIERGVVTREEAQSMDENALGQMLLRGGVSTTRIVTDVSGRGVGLDAVRHAVEALKGEVGLRSVSGEGTTVEILLPISLSAMPALSTQVDDTAVLIPLHSVRRTIRVSRRDISRDADGERLVVDDRVIPFVPLRRALNRPEGARSDMQSAVVLEADGELAAVGVDELGGSRSIVVREIPDHVAATAVVAGASLGDEGIPELVLAPSGLVRAASGPAAADDEPRARDAPPLLVIDDSLTTRMLEQSILESAGYEVDLAISGEEALEKARSRRYGVFIVDVEMPGMDGYEFIAKARSDPELRKTASILVTSRADPESKRRGKEVGARAYIVKSEFDQTELLEAIKRLVE